MAKLEDLRELVKGIDRNKIKNIHIVGNSSTKATLFDEFYEALLNDKFNTDEEYAKHFYGGNLNYQAYYKLKDRLQERLINTVFFIDVNKGKAASIEKAYYECYKNALAIKILLGKRIRRPALRLAKKTLKKALYFGFTDIAIEISRHLKVHYGSLGSDVKNFNHYKVILDRQLKIYEKEIIVEDHRITTVLLNSNGSTANIDYEKKFDSFYSDVKIILKKYISYKIVLNSYIFFFAYHEIRSEWNKVINRADELIELLTNKSQYFTSNLLGIAYQRKILGHYMMREFSLCNKFLPKCFKLFTIGSYNWFSLQEINFRIQLHSEQFEEATNIVEEVYKNKNENLLYTNMIEVWSIHHAFIYYLVLTGRVKQKIKRKDTSKIFRLNKLLNEVPNYAKDKEGRNTNILVIQILFLLEYQKYDKLIDFEESLKAYTRRHLNGKRTLRSKYFFKMVICLINEGFEGRKVEKKVQKFLMELRTTPIQKAKQSAELEVIPYETLWEFVLDSLDRHKK